MKKAATAGDPGTWRERLYAALAAKEGCDDPRDVWTRSQPRAGTAEPEPQLSTSQ